MIIATDNSDDVLQNDNKVEWKSENAISSNDTTVVKNTDNKTGVSTNTTVGKQTQSSVNKSIILLIPIIIAILIVGMLAYVFLINPTHSKITTSTTTILSTNTQNQTTAIIQQSSNINSCTAITQPGVYSFDSNITTTIQDGSCIKITASNVRINGNGNHLKGNGPYVDINPYTYGILILGATNVTINNLNVTRFSYLIYMNNTSLSKISNDELSNGTLSDLYMENSFRNTIENNTIYGSQSRFGGINIESGGDNKFLYLTVINNAYYGVNLNSSGNSFKNDVFIQNPTDFICGINSNLKNTNNFSSTSCKLNNYCNFVQCSVNEFYNIRNVKLSNNINSCGSINKYGSYSLSNNLNLGTFVNVTSTEQSCITINSPNVKLNCNGHTISNGYYGVLLNNEYNTTIENCNFENDTYGAFINTDINTQLNNINANAGRVGIYIENSTAGVVSNSTEKENNIGIYENSSNGFEFLNDTTLQNVYGTYVSGGQSNIFQKINTKTNTGGDFYCPANSYNNSGIATVGNLSCGTTDCTWASLECTKLLPPPLAIIPVFKCEAITIPGVYELDSNLTSYGTCFTISAPNVAFNCNNNQFIGGNGGYGILDNGNSNVSIKNCNINNYNYGIYISGANNINVNNVNVNNVNYGVMFSNINNGSINNVKVASFKNTGINVSNANMLNIENNNANYGIYESSGFVLSNVYNSIITGNSGQNNPNYGVVMIDSGNNIVQKNIAFNNAVFDYYCSGIDNGLYSNKIGINEGINKDGCPWLVEINPESNLECFSFSNSGDISFTSDMVYSYGNTCYTINNELGKITNDTTINCNGHTIYATNGGTFANINTSGVVIENCNLDNFSTAIIDNGPKLNIYNTTITRANIGILTNNAKLPNIINVAITNSTNGIEVFNTSHGVVKNSKIFDNIVGIETFNDASTSFLNNTVDNNQIGFEMLNGTSLVSLQNNILLNNGYVGILCKGNSGLSSSGNSDLGQNECSLNNGCTWMTTSSLCRT